MQRVEERHGLAGNVPQFDVFIQGVGIRAEGWRGVHDFVDDHRADLGAGIGGAEGVPALGHEMFDAVTGDIAAKGDAVDLRAEFKTVPVAGEVGAIAGKQVNFLAQGAESEAVGAVVVELAFVEGDVAAGRDDGIGRDAVLGGLVVVVGEEPAADGCRAGGGVIEFNGV